MQAFLFLSFLKDEMIGDVSLKPFLIMSIHKMHNIDVSAIINYKGTLDSKMIQHAKEMQKKDLRSYEVD